MSRFGRTLRAAFFPLLGLLGVGLLAWGAVGWWTFYRDLFVEEELTLAALVEESEPIIYRRAGDLHDRGFDSISATGQKTEPLAVPWSVPFVGRLEFVDAAHPGIVNGSLGPNKPSLPPDVRDRALRLPGLRGYVEPRLTDFVDPFSRGGGSPAPSVEMPPPAPLDSLPLGIPLPKLPEPSLKPEALTEPLPRGEVLTGEDFDEARRRLVKNWARPVDERARLVRTARGYESLADPKPIAWTETLHAIDGPRRLDFAPGADAHESRYNRGVNLFLRDDEFAYEFSFAKGERSCWSRIGVELPDAKEFLEWRPRFPQPHHDPTENYDFLRASRTDFVGPAGERIAKIERIDDERLWIDCASDPETEASWRFQAIVRTDFDDAVERYVGFQTSWGGFIGGPATRSRSANRGVRRMELLDGEPVVVEELTDSVGASDSSDAASDEASDEAMAGAAPTHIGRTLTTTVLDPKFSPSAFAPESYGADAWPAPQPMPVWRTYRAALAGGAALVALAVVGALGRRTAPRRIEKDTAEGSRAPLASPSTRRFAPRFGLVSLFAMTLIAIGAAGRVKVRLDEADEQHAFEHTFWSIDVTTQFVRREPGFPWMFFATDMRPVDAPLTEVRVGWGKDAEDVAPLMRRSPAVSYATNERCDPALPEESRDATVETALGLKLPEFQKAWENDGAPFGDLPRGEALKGEERDATIREMLAAWDRARDAPPPRSYVLRSSFTFAKRGETIVVREGEKSWTIDLEPGRLHIETNDGRFRRRFGHADGTWRLLSRTPADEEPTPYDPVVDLDHLYLSDGFDRPTDADADWYYAYRQETPGTWGGFSGPAFELRDGAPDLPVPPFAKAPGVEYRSPPYDTSPLNLREFEDAAIERLAPSAGEGFYVELLKTRGIRWDTHEGTRTAVVAAFVVRPEFDWAISDLELTERYERRVESKNPFLPRVDGKPPIEVVPFARVLRSRTTLARQDGRVVPLGVRLQRSEKRGEKTYAGPPLLCRYAVEFDPDLSRPIFDRPTVDSPDPPVPVDPPRVWWPLATFAAGAVTLVVAGVRRFVFKQGAPR